MARTGRPPVPNEVKRMRGTARPDRTPLPAEVVVLPQAGGVPDVPSGLGEPGVEFWRRAWHEALTWISPVSDGAQIEEAARLADDLACARERYRATREPADGRIVAALSKSFTESLSALGFNPTSRTRLGVAEVKRVSKLEQLLADREDRRSAARP